MTTNQTVHTLNNVKNNIYNIIRNHHLMGLETPVYEEKKYDHVIILLWYRYMYIVLH